MGMFEKWYKNGKFWISCRVDLTTSTGSKFKQNELWKWIKWADKMNTSEPSESYENYNSEDININIKCKKWIL